MSYFLGALFWKDRLGKGPLLHRGDAHLFLLVIESAVDGLEKKIEGKRFFNEIEGTQFHGRHGC